MGQIGIAGFDTPHQEDRYQHNGQGTGNGDMGQIDKRRKQPHVKQNRFGIAKGKGQSRQEAGVSLA